MRKFGIDTAPVFINHPIPGDFVRHERGLQFSHDLRNSLLAVAKLEKPIRYENLPLLKKRKAISLYVKTYEALYKYLITTAGKGNMSKSSEHSIFWDIGKIEQYALTEENGMLRLKLTDIDPYISRSRKRRTQLVDSCISSLEKIKTMSDTSIWTRRKYGTKITNLVELFRKEKPYWTLM